MKILYFYQYYSTPKGSWGTRVHEFARRWVEAGHQVTIVTSIYQKSDLTASRLIEDQFFEGVKVKILNIQVTNKDSFYKRVLKFLQYSLLSCWYAFSLETDIVIASSGPISVGLPGLVAKYFRGRKLIFEVRDLWPEGMIQLGLLKNKFLQKTAYWFERRCYNASNLIITLSPGMSEWIKEKYGISKTISIPNAADNDLFGKIAPIDDLPEWLPLKSYILYTGNIGKTNNSELLLSVARLLKSQKRDDIKIVIIGDGQQKEMLQSLASKEQLDNFYILNLMPKSQLVAWVQNALCSVVPLQDLPILDTSSPNKLFDSIAAGVPVLQTTKGWIAKLVSKNECGFTISATHPEDMVKRIVYLKKNPAVRAKMGVNASHLSLEEFDKIKLADKMLEALENVYSNRSIEKTGRKQNECQAEYPHYRS